MLFSNYGSINFNNISLSHDDGISIYNSKNNNFNNNTFRYNGYNDNYFELDMDYAISLWIFSNFNTLFGNSISKQQGGSGILIKNSNHNAIINNFIINNSRSGVVILSANNIIISNNNISKNELVSGIELTSSNNISIYNNILIGNGFLGFGLSSSETNNLEISNNKIDYSIIGIFFMYQDTCRGNSIINNTISRCLFGVLIASLRLTNSLIMKNTFTLNGVGIGLFGGGNNHILKNNFIVNEIHASFINSFLNFWLNNYWDDWPGFIPRPIWGEISFDTDLTNDNMIRWVNFDWHPAREPYNFGE